MSDSERRDVPPGVLDQSVTIRTHGGQGKTYEGTVVAFGVDWISLRTRTGLTVHIAQSAGPVIEVFDDQSG